MLLLVVGLTMPAVCALERATLKTSGTLLLLILVLPTQGLWVMTGCNV